MKKFVFFVLVMTFVLAMGGTAFAAALTGNAGTFYEGVQRDVSVRFQYNNGVGSAASPDATQTNALVYRVTATNLGSSAPVVSYYNGSTWAPLAASATPTDAVYYSAPAFTMPTGAAYDVTAKFRVTYPTGTAGTGSLAFAVIRETTQTPTAAAINSNAARTFSVDILTSSSGTPVPPRTYGDTTPTPGGLSLWTYQDLHDASPKYEGGYAQFDNLANATYDNPHGGYDSTTNKCKVCHAVHRAEGAYYLLRADSQDDACSYCHIGGSAHSTKVVYNLNPDGIYTMNGHTIGAQTNIPDSTTRQVAQQVTLSTTDANGNELSEQISVRSYSDQKNKMYRFTRHHAQEAVSSGRSGYIKVGPLALRCMNCHQPHNATEMVWRPRTFAPFNGTTYSTADDGAFMTAGYKLLRRYPSGSTVGTANAYGYYDEVQAVKVPEDKLEPGVNYSRNQSGEFTYAENGVTRSAPSWIAQDIHEPASGTGVYRYPNTVNTAALSVWCADCHNLNIGGWEPLAADKVELGFKAHTERTHPAPYYGAYTGPGQCYSCHRNDLPTIMGSTTNFGGHAENAMTGSNRNSCTQCHYGTADYAETRFTQSNIPAMGNNTVKDSDFPHSGQGNSIKLLGAYTISSPTAYSTLVSATITEDNLDAVCIRCHPGVGTHN